MKTSSSFPYPRLLLAMFALGLTALAQPPPANTEKSAPPAQTPQPADAETAPAPAPTPPPAAEAEKPDDEKPLRRIDEPVEPERRRSRARRSTSGSGPTFGDHAVTKGKRVQEAVSILGSTTVEGEVAHDAVSVLGATKIGPDAKVGGAAVAVLGRLEVRGEVDQGAVSVLGSAIIDGRVGQEVVCVLGDLHLGPNAVIDGDIVHVGGTLTKDPRAVVNGNEVRVPIGKLEVDWLVAYVRHCVMLGRPLAFASELGWAWLIAFGFLAFYLLLAVLFTRPLTKCVETLETRPGESILAAVLTVLLTPVAIVLLCFTVIGIVLVPFVLLGLVFAGLFGKATMLAWAGRRFTKLLGDGVASHLVFAVLIGGLLVLLLYTVPVFGFLLMKLLGWLGMGVVVYTMLLAMKRPKPVGAAAGVGGGGGGGATPEMAPTVPPSGPSPSAPVSAVAPMAMPPAGTFGAAPDTPSPAVSGLVATPPPAPEPPPVAAGFVPPVAGVVPPSTPPAPQVAPAGVPRQPVLIASTLPRAGFFIRLGALLLDIVLLAVVAAFFVNLVPRPLRVFGFDPPGMLPLLAIYGAVMWKLKGTTIGGIVCGLKVVRVDNRPLDWPTAIVRALGCFLSFVVVGLGFIWVAIDDEKQSWHDKIAGTTVVHVPKGVSLL